MAVVPYDYLHQEIVATTLILPRDNDSFYNPTVLNHSGFAADGTHYTNGVQDAGPIFASWFTEATGPYRGDGQAFPNAGLILLSKIAMTILNETTPALTLWMQFLLQDNQALANNFNSSNSGWTPTGLSYADGVVSVVYRPDEGSIDITSPMVVTMDFVQDKVYLDVAVVGP